jgi:ribosomal protein L14E/L6E/L27E
MNRLKQGQVVISGKGRDKGVWFVVLDVAAEHDGEYAWLADGKLRTVEKPKKKKVKHIRPTTHIDCSLKDRLLNRDIISNADVRKSIRKFAPDADGEV